jgi:hypothetical protein
MQGLFDEPAAAAPAPAPATPKVDPVQAAEQLFASANKDLLPETFDALKRMPEEVRAAVEEVAHVIFRAEAMRLLTQRAADDAAKVDPSRSVNVLVHSGKLAALSAVGYLSGAPWHLADGAMLKRIVDDLAGASHLDSATQRLRTVKCVNLFVAAVESDDRESYLKAIKGLVKRHKVNGLVFDAELVEWSPEAEFLAACEEIGLRPVHIGIADRRRASQHSMMRPELSQLRTPALYVDSTGRPLKLSDTGEVLLQPAATQAAATAPAVPAARAAAPAPAPAPAAVELPAGVASSSAVQSRIAKLREQQSSRRVARP